MMILDTEDPLLDAVPAHESVEWSSIGRLTWVVFLDVFLWFKWLMALGFVGAGASWLGILIWEWGESITWEDLSFILISTTASLLTILGGLGLFRQSWLRFKDLQGTRCLATAEKLYIWTPNKGLNVLFWGSLPELRGQFFAAGVFSLYYNDADRRRYLFHQVVGDAAALQQLQNLRWKALEV